jgi:hypothetical protein
MALTKLNFSGQPNLPSASMPTDSVLQVKSGVFATETQLTQTSNQASGISVSITPISTSNKILVKAVFPLQIGTSGLIVCTIYRGSTNLGSDSMGLGRFFNNGGVQADRNFAIQYLDSPSTTSATTYQVYLKCSGGTHYWGVGNASGSITAMEIKA